MEPSRLTTRLEGREPRGSENQPQLAVFPRERLKGGLQQPPTSPPARESEQALRSTRGEDHVDTEPSHVPADRSGGLCLQFQGSVSACLLAGQDSRETDIAWYGLVSRNNREQDPTSLGKMPRKPR